MLKNEVHLLEELFPQWQKYADGFVFLDDGSNDGSYEFLQKNKEKYNIREIIRLDRDPSKLVIESEVRQMLYDAALKYSNKIICLDADEYLDGELTKEQLENILDANQDTLFVLPWVQYVSKTSIRVDGPWNSNFKDRVACYQKREVFRPIHMHSEHLPRPGRVQMLGFPTLFIAHLQWLDKKAVAVKQYFWKVTDYVNHHVHGANVISPTEYDASINNFQWEIVELPEELCLKVNPDLYSKYPIENNYKFKFIKENIKKYNIPNLNDWGMNIHG